MSATADASNECEQRQVAAALALLQRLPPKGLETNLKTFSIIAPCLECGLDPYISRPLQVCRDHDVNLYFVKSEYNCDADMHRSPWSNRYFPTSDNPEVEDRLYYPSERLRRLEVMFNEVFDAYKTSYYEGGVSSVYLWDLEEGFGGAFLIRKELSPPNATGTGLWESIHVVEVRESVAETSVTEYKLTTSIRVRTDSTDTSKASTGLDAWVTRQSGCSSRKKVIGDEQILAQIGRMIEDMENSIRQHIDSVCIAKQREILASCRRPADPSDEFSTRVPRANK